MANAEAKGGAAKEGGGSKKTLVLIIVAVLVLLAGGGGAAYWFLLRGGEHAEEEAPAKKKVHAPPVFMTLEPFVVNLMPHDAEQYLQMDLDLKVAEQAVTDQIKLHMPEIRNGILLLLSGKRGEDLASAEGKQKLAEEIRGKVNKILGVEGEDEGVTGVFFTSFVIQ